MRCADQGRVRNNLVKTRSSCLGLIAGACHIRVEATIKYAQSRRLNQASQPRTLIITMVSFKAIVATALAILPSTIAAPAPSSEVLDTRQNGAWQWWTEGSGQFSCQQQGGGKYTCNWSGQKGGGMVAGTGWGAGRKCVTRSIVPAVNADRT